MKKAQIVSLMVSVFVTMPIWYFLLYRILLAIAASELMWFLYWIYIPAGLFASILAKFEMEKS